MTPPESTCANTPPRQSGRSAIARWAARGKQYVVQLRAVPGGIVMQQLLYAPEVRTIDELGIAETSVKEAELALAQQLIGQISADRFDASAYRDDVKARIEAAIERKIEGKEIEVAPTLAEPGGQVIDLMEALRASVKQKTPAQATAPARKPPRKAAPAPPAPRARTARR